MELAISFGLPAALMLVGLALWLLVRSLQRGMFGPDPFERGWWTAFVILALLHATDLPLYSGQINVVGWILLAGLRAAAGLGRKRFSLVLGQGCLGQGAIEVLPGQHPIAAPTTVNHVVPRR